jgi:hypothetical protein
MRMVVHFIDIGWIVDHHCSHFLFKSNTTCVTCGAGTAYIPIFGDVRVDRFIICNVLKVIVCPFALLQWYLYWISFWISNTNTIVKAVSQRRISNTNTIVKAVNQRRISNTNTIVKAVNQRRISNTNTIVKAVSQRRISNTNTIVKAVNQRRISNTNTIVKAVRFLQWYLYWISFSDLRLLQ